MLSLYRLFIFFFDRSHSFPLFEIQASALLSYDLWAQIQRIRDILLSSRLRLYFRVAFIIHARTSYQYWKDRNGIAYHKYTNINPMNYCICAPVKI